MNQIFFGQQFTQLIRIYLRSGGPSSLLFGRRGEKDAWYVYFTRRLHLVQDRDCCLIGRKKQKILRNPAPISQAKDLTSAAIR